VLINRWHRANGDHIGFRRGNSKPSAFAALSYRAFRILPLLATVLPGGGICPRKLLRYAVSTFSEFLPIRKRLATRGGR
jgi:hypothetical protein